MTSAQEQTVARYHELMQVNAAAHVLRTTREIGLLDQLRQRQHTIDELCSALGLAIEPTRLLVDALVAIGVVERYGEDFALSQAARLLCEYDQDFGDAKWNRLSATLKPDPSSGSTKNTDEYFAYQAATQWVHTPAAIQAAEVLDIGGEGQLGTKILDLGCGSAVWSCAMAHRDPTATLTVVDQKGAIESARSTANSIGLTSRLEAIIGDPLEAEVPADAYDLTLLAQQTTAIDDDSAIKLLGHAFSATKPSGRVVVIDLFRGPAKAAPNADEAASDDGYARPTLAESVEALKICVSTDHGRLRTLQQAKDLLIRAGLQRVQFAYLSASRLNLGIAVGEKPAS